MKKILLLTLTIVGTTFQLTAQNRYVTPNAFANVTVDTSIVYGTATNFLGNSQPLMMDVYRPVGDLATKRATIIMVHSGSFLPSGSSPTAPTSWGNRRDSAMVEICTQLAKRGFTAISMTHRLGWNPAATTQERRAAGIIQAVYRATQDLRTCIRFIKLDAAGANLYKIDTNAITVGGSSSGAYVAIHGSALNKTSEVTTLPKFRFLAGEASNYPPIGTPMINQTNTSPPSSWGGLAPYLDGFTAGSNQGPGSNYQLVWSIGGAVGDSSWIEAGEQPIISMHGPADPTTPFGTAVVNVAGTGNAIVEVSGGLDVTRRSIAVGNIPASITGVNDNPLADTLPALKRFLGAANGFEPFNWYNGSFALNPAASKSRALLYIDTMLRYFIPRAVRILNLDTASVLGFSDNNLLSSSVSIYPNPATTQINIAVDGNDLTIKGFRLFDILGHEVTRANRVIENFVTIQTAGFAKGMYLLQVETDKGLVSKKVLID